MYRYWKGSIVWNILSMTIVELNEETEILEADAELFDL